MTTKRIFTQLFLGSLWLAITSFTTRDPQAENSFRTVAIGSGEWMAENLNVSHFRNGDPIFEANTYEKWEYASIHGLPAWCYYNNNPRYGKKYGKLYNGWAIRDERGLGPEGWHVPSDKEWTEMAEALHNEDAGGETLRASAGWDCNSNGDGDGFSALPGGYRTHEMPKYYGGPFYGAGEGGYFWTSTGYVVDNIWVRTVSCEAPSIGKTTFDRTAGMSVRLVKDRK